MLDQKKLDIFKRWVCPDQACFLSIMQNLKKNGPGTTTVVRVFWSLLKTPPIDCLCCPSRESRLVSGKNLSRLLSSSPETSEYCCRIEIPWSPVQNFKKKLKTSTALDGTCCARETNRIWLKDILDL